MQAKVHEKLTGEREAATTSASAKLHHHIMASTSFDATRRSIAGPGLQPLAKWCEVDGQPSNHHDGRAGEEARNTRSSSSSEHGST